MSFKTDFKSQIPSFLRLNKSLRVVKSTFFRVENGLAYIFVKMWVGPHAHQANILKYPQNNEFLNSMVR